MEPQERPRHPPGHFSPYKAPRSLDADDEERVIAGPSSATARTMLSDRAAPAEPTQHQLSQQDTDELTPADVARTPQKRMPRLPSLAAPENESASTQRQQPSSPTNHTNNHNHLPRKRVPSQSTAVPFDQAAAGPSSSSRSQQLSGRAAKTRPVSAAQAPLDADAVVQAANPAHPDHRVWIERYGSTARHRRSSEFSRSIRPPSQSGEMSRDSSMGSVEASKRNHTISNGALLAAAQDSPARTTPSQSSSIIGSTRRTSLTGSYIPGQSSSDDSASPAILGSTRPRPSSPHRVARSSSPTSMASTHQGQESPYGSRRTSHAKKASATRQKDARRKPKVVAPPPLPPPRVSSTLAGAFPSEPSVTDSLGHLHSDQRTLSSLHHSTDGELQGGKPSPIEKDAPVTLITQATRRSSKASPTVATPEEKSAPGPQLRDVPDSSSRRSSHALPPPPLSQMFPMPPPLPLPSAPRTQGSGNTNQVRFALETDEPASLPPSTSTPEALGRPSSQNARSSRRGASLDLLRETFNFGSFRGMSTPTAEGSNTLSEQQKPLAPPPTTSTTQSLPRGPSRVRASLDIARPILSAFGRSSSTQVPKVADEDISEDDDEVAVAGSASRRKKRFEAIKAALRLGMRPQAPQELSPIRTSSGGFPENNREYYPVLSEPYRPRATQSMDIPRRAVPKYVDWTKEGTGMTTSATTPALSGTVALDGALAPPSAALPPRSRLSFVGEEMDEAPEFQENEQERRSAEADLALDVAQGQEMTQEAQQMYLEPKLVTEESVDQSAVTAHDASRAYDEYKLPEVTTSPTAVANATSPAGSDYPGAVQGSVPSTGGRPSLDQSHVGASTGSAFERSRSPAADSGSKGRKIRLASFLNKPKKEAEKPSIAHQRERIGSPVSVLSTAAPSLSHGDSTGDASRDAGFSAASDGFPAGGSTLETPFEVQSQSFGGWRSRVSSFGSIKSGKKSRSMTSGATEATKVPPVPDIAFYSPELLRSASSYQADDWRRRIAEQSSTRMSFSRSADQPASLADRRPSQQNGPLEFSPSKVPPPISSQNRSQSKVRKSPFTAVIAAGRKSFSRERSRPELVQSAESDERTIRKTLGLALMSEAESPTSARPGEERIDSQLQSASESAEGVEEDEPWDGMDDDRVRHQVPEPQLVDGQEEAKPLDEIQEQDGESSQGFSTPVSKPAPLRSGTTPESRDHVPKTGSLQDSAVLSPRSPSQNGLFQRHDRTGSFSSRRSGKHAQPAQLQIPLSPSGAPIASPPAFDTSNASERAIQPPASPSLSATLPSPSLRTTPWKNVNPARFFSTSEKGTAVPSTTNSARTSFSQDRERLPVASPYVTHAPMSSSKSSTGLRNAFKKMGGLGKGFGVASPTMNGISSDYFKDFYSLQDHGEGEDKMEHLIEDGPLSQAPRSPWRSEQLNRRPSLNTSKSSGVTSPGPRSASQLGQEGDRSFVDYSRRGSGKGARLTSPLIDGQSDGLGFDSQSLALTPAGTELFAGSVHPLQNVGPQAGSSSVGGADTSDAFQGRTMAKTGLPSAPATAGYFPPLSHSYSMQSLDGLLSPATVPKSASSLSPRSPAQGGPTTELSAFDAMVKAQQLREQEMLRSITARSRLGVPNTPSLSSSVSNGASPSSPSVPDRKGSFSSSRSASMLRGQSSPAKGSPHSHQPTVPPLTRNAASYSSGNTVGSPAGGAKGLNGAAGNLGQVGVSPSRI